MNKFEIGQRVKLLVNDYQSEDDNEMLPGSLGTIVSCTGVKFYTVELDKEVDEAKEWLFLEDELEAV